MKRTAMKDALSSLISRKEDIDTTNGTTNDLVIETEKERSNSLNNDATRDIGKDTANENSSYMSKDTPKDKAKKRGFGKVVNFYFYPEDASALDSLVAHYNRGKVARLKISRSDYIRLLLHKEVKKHAKHLESTEKLRLIMDLKS